MIGFPLYGGAMMRWSAALVVLATVAATGCDSTSPTPPGTKLVEMPVVKSVLSGHVASVGGVIRAGQPFEETYHFRGPALGGVDNPYFTVKFERFIAEMAPADAAGPRSIDTLRDLSIVVAANTAWKMSGSCSDVASVVESAGRLSVELHCSVAISRKSGSLKLESGITISATGSINASRDMEWDVVPGR